MWSRGCNWERRTNARSGRKLKWWKRPDLGKRPKFSREEKAVEGIMHVEKRKRVRRITESKRVKILAIQKMQKSAKGRPDGTGKKREPGRILEGARITVAPKRVKRCGAVYPHYRTVIGGQRLNGRNIEMRDQTRAFSRNFVK